MSKVARYVIVAVVAFLLGAVTFRLMADGSATAAKPSANESKSAVARTFAIDGMTCQGCVDTITSTLKALPGVKSVEVSLAEKQAVVSADPGNAPSEKIVAAIEAKGYKARLASDKTTSAPASTKSPILVNITRGKNELHAVSMAIGLAQSAIKDGRPAVVFLNVEAPVFAAKNLGDDVKFADFPPIKQMLADFIAAGGRVLVCGHCAHVTGVSHDDLISGAKTTAHGDLFDAVSPGTVVFSY